jgi:glucokinase
LKVFLGIDVGGTNVKLAVVGAGGAVHARGVLETKAEEGPRKAFERISSSVATLVRFRRNVEVVAAGVGCAGLVNPAKGWLHASPNLTEWENSPLGRISRRALGVYTIVENDANSAAYGEFTAGACRGVKNLVFITLGTGVGGGVITEGRLLRGARNYAAEVGHTAVSADGPRCRCGSRGCLEAYVGTYGLLRSARERMKEKGTGLLAGWVGREKRRLTPHLIFEAARRRDPAARAVVKQAGENLGVGIASLINIFNPEAVVVGGGVAESFDLLRPHVERVVRRRAFAESARLAKIVPSRLGNDATAVGAAMLARDAAGRPAGRRG